MLLHQGDSVGQSIAHLVQAMYQQVGLKFTLQTINQNDYFQNYVEEGKFQIGLWEWDAPLYPISGSRPVYQEPQGKNLIQNFDAVSSPQIDAPGASFAMWIRGQCSGLN